MTDTGTMGIHIGPYDYTNDIRVNVWLSCDVTFATLYFTKPRVITMLTILVGFRAPWTQERFELWGVCEELNLSSLPTHHSHALAQ